MSLYDQFKTDTDTEKSGIYYTVYGEDGEDLFRILIARAGGANKAFEKAQEQENKKYKRQIATDNLSLAKRTKLMIGIYSRTVILNWELWIDDKWIQGVDVDGDGEVVPFTRENVIKILQENEELYTDVAAEANRLSNFRKAEQEEEAKN